MKIYAKLKIVFKLTGFLKGVNPQLEVDLVKRKLNLCKFHGRCNIDGKLAVDAQFSANLVDRARE